MEIWMEDEEGNVSSLGSMADLVRRGTWSTPEPGDRSSYWSEVSEYVNSYVTPSPGEPDLLHRLIRSNATQTSMYEELPYPDFSQIPSVRGVFVFLFLLEFVIGVCGNLLVCLTVYRTKAMHSPVNYYIVNLGVCDFLVGAFVLPTKLFELTAEANVNMLNDGLCTAVRYLETIVIFASVFTLVAICIERYYAVVYPVHSRIYLTHSRIGRVLMMVWIIPCIVAAPNLYPATATMHHLFSDFGEFTRTTCFDRFTDEFRRAYFLFLFFFMYVLPLLFIATTCVSIFRALMRKIPAQPHRDPRAVIMEKGRRKVAKMVLVIVFVFIMCWSPYLLVTVVTQLQTENFLHNGHFFFTMLCINLLGFTNSCINPIIYFAMSARFRKGFKAILTSMWECTKSTRFSPRSSSSSTMMRRNSARLPTTNGYANQGVQQRRNASPSPSPHTPNDSTGNIKERPASLPPRNNAVRRQRSQTILLSFHTHGTNNCEAQLIPLASCENGLYHNQFQFEDFHLAQESSIV